MAIDFSGLTKASDILDADAAGVREVPIDKVQADPDQPRKSFNAQALSELAESIRTHGIIQPLVVKINPDGGFIIVAGERRWRAAMQAKFATVPVIVRDDLDSFAQVVENIQRENLTPMELYRWIAAQLDVPEMTQDQLAKKLGKSKTWISFYASITKMPETFRAALNEGLASDVTALNQLFKLWKQEPAPAEKLATSGSPITRQAVGALAEKIQARSTATDGKGGSIKPKAEGKAGTGTRKNDGAAKDAATSAPSPAESTSVPSAMKSIRIRVRFEGANYNVRYITQRVGKQGVEVMLEGDDGKTPYAPLSALQLISITEV